MRATKSAVALAVVSCLFTAEAYGQRDATDWQNALAPGQVFSEEREVVVLHREFLDQGAEYLSPGGLEARLVREGSDGTEISHDAGAFFAPPAGLYRYWLEGTSQITPFASRLPRVGELPTGMAIIGSAPTADAGLVDLPAASSAESGDIVVSLLRLGPASESGTARFLLQRRVRLGDAPRAVQMPVGEVVGAAWSRREQRLVGLSRPLRVAKGGHAKYRSENRQDRAALVVRADRGDELADFAPEFDEQVSLWLEGRKVPPDATARAADCTYAFWYDLAAAPAEVEVEWRGRHLDRTLSMRAGEVHAIDGVLMARPTLTIDLALPAALRSEALELELRSEATRRILVSERVRPGVSRRILQDVPSLPIEVSLRTPYGETTEQIDLSSGKDGYLLFEPNLTRVFGEVTRGGDPHAATIQFTTLRGQKVNAVTDSRGSYEVVVVEPLAMVSVELEGRPQAPWTDYFTKPLGETTELDFDLPASEHQVRVGDRQTGEGISGALVAFRNSYAIEPAAGAVSREVARHGRDRGVSQTVLSDDQGVAWLPPLRVGSVEVHVSAEGYESPKEPLRAVVEDVGESLTLEVLLEPLADRVEVVALLASGNPAAGAEFQLLRSVESGMALTSGSADGGGRFTLPRSGSGMVLVVRHPLAGGLAREWTVDPERSETVLQLQPPSGQALRVRALRAGGQVAESEVALGVLTEAGLASGGVLHWLFGAQLDASGLVTLTGLPAAPVQVLAWDRSRSPEAQVGALNSLSTSVSWPRSEIIEIQVAE